MNKVAKNYRNQAIEPEKKCREEMLKELFELSTKLTERLDCLCETGIDKEAWIRLEGAEVEEARKEGCTTIGKEQVLKCKETLIALKKGDQDISTAILNLNDEEWIWSFEEFQKMDKLSVEIQLMEP